VSGGASGQWRRRGAEAKLALATAATFPVPAVPILLLASSVVLIVAAAIAIYGNGPLVALSLCLGAIVPFRNSERQRTVGRALAFLGIGGALGGLALSAGAIEIGPPYQPSSSTPYLVGLFAFVFRAIALRAESVIRWSSPRWVAGTIARQLGTPSAIMAALRARDDPAGEEAIDAAVVALSLVGEAAIPNEERDRRAFFIDVYNVLARHAGRGRASGRALSVMEAGRTRYHIATFLFSLDDIEHGILRANARHPLLHYRPFATEDHRLSLCVPLDPRIHFALHCGAAWCPPLRAYRGSTLDASLERATRAHVRQTTRIDERARTISISGIFDRYAEDFGGMIGVRRFLEKYLQRAKGSLDAYRIEIVPDDWSSPTATIEPSPDESAT